jgi:hypothetical protein
MVQATIGRHNQNTNFTICCIYHGKPWISVPGSNGIIPCLQIICLRYQAESTGLFYDESIYDRASGSQLDGVKIWLDAYDCVRR